MSNAAIPSPLTGPNAAAGPLIVSRSNPRYFAVDSNDVERAVYLTGSPGRPWPFA